MRLLIWLFPALIACGEYQSHNNVPADSLITQWPSWGRDAGGQRFSELDQINTTNVARLERAWTIHTGDWSDGERYRWRSAFECTPLFVNGRLYVITPFARILALDPETGREFWNFDPRLNLEAGGGDSAHRGVAYWTDGAKHRLFFGTMGGGLWCIDAQTGKPVVSFGDSGRVEHARMTSPPALFDNLVIAGGLQPYIRAYDVHTGAMVWERTKIPAPDDPDFATWNGDGIRKQGSSFCWPPMSVDVERGMLFVPTDSPTYDYYGADRHGANRPCNSLLALDAKTGKTIWQFQFSHHDVWDYDVPAQPNLVTVQRNGRDVDAVAQVTKQGFVFLFNRDTGEPLFDIEERPVAQSTVPGEQLSPTQPFPVAPPPFARTDAHADEYARVTPEHEARSREAFKQWNIGHVFVPPSLDGVVMYPGTNGGGDWGGGCFDPRTGLLYVSAENTGKVMKLQPTGLGDNHYRLASAGYRDNRFWFGDLFMPFVTPPWGTLTALDLNAGTIAWQVPLGMNESLVAGGIDNTGSPGIGGGIATAGGLVFIGASNDRRFRAFDSATGKALWVSEVDGSAHAVPMTYIGPATGKQYIVVACGGGHKYNTVFSDALIAFALPDGK